jgi:succinate dehydrogenase hydrophobic anchor subunit
MEAALVISLLVIVMLVVPWMVTPAVSKQSVPFTSDRERRLWFWVLVVVVAIHATLGPAQLLAEALRERNLLRVSVVVGLLLVGAAVVGRWMKRRPGQREIGVALGIAAVYLMAWIRIHSWEERTHLFEYGLVAILIYQALTERLQHDRVLVPAVLAVAVTGLLGWLDEGIQALLPDRVYDLRDAGFNALAGPMAIGASLELFQSRSAGA